MSKPETTDLKSKSLQKKYIKDFYFPAIDVKPNVNFPFKKSLKFKSTQKAYVPLQAQNITPTNYEINPQINFQSKKNIVQASSTDKLKEMIAKQQMNRKASSASKDFLNKSAIYFTKRQMQIFEKTSIELEQKKSKLGQKFMQRKQSFQSFKKMKQMLREQEKQDLLNDLQFKRQQREREQRIKQKERSNQVVFIHEQKLAKIDMERGLKFRNRQQQLNLVKKAYIETEDDSHFKKMQNFKAKRNHMHLLESRLLFLMNEKVKNIQDDDFLDERMTSRSFFREDISQQSRSKELTGR